jgi:hypothetical protein
MPDAAPETTPDPANITDERAARRFHQIRRLEREVGKVDARIAIAKTKVKTLNEERDGLLARLFTAARDEGELPLFDLDEE